MSFSIYLPIAFSRNGSLFFSSPFGAWFSAIVVDPIRVAIAQRPKPSVWYPVLSTQSHIAQNHPNTHTLAWSKGSLYLRVMCVCVRIYFGFRYAMRLPSKWSRKIVSVCYICRVCTQTHMQKRTNSIPRGFANDLNFPARTLFQRGSKFRIRIHMQYILCARLVWDDRSRMWDRFIYKKGLYSTAHTHTTINDVQCGRAGKKIDADDDDDVGFHCKCFWAQKSPQPEVLAPERNDGKLGRMWRRQTIYKSTTNIGIAFDVHTTGISIFG